MGVTRIPFDAEQAAFRQCLGVPDDYIVPYWLALGYPQEGARRAKQVEIDIEGRIHSNHWD